MNNLTEEEILSLGFNPPSEFRRFKSPTIETATGACTIHVRVTSKGDYDVMHQGYHYINTVQTLQQLQDTIWVLTGFTKTSFV